MRKKAEEKAASTSGDARVTPEDVQQVEFRLAFRGYNERDVDAFLDRVTEDLAWYVEENQRLRTGTATPSAPGGTGAAHAEAEQIIAAARAEAARILGEAEARAAVTGVAPGDARTAVAPFLNTEREFLQSLGALVQEHAEEIKQMVLTLREKAEGSTPPAPGAEGPADALQAPGAASDSTAAQEPERAEKPETAREAGDAFAPIEPPDSPEVADAEQDPVSEPAAAQLRRDSGDRSLRELFWGED